MIIAALLGAIAGILCGLVPGLHTNLIASGVLLIEKDAWWWVVFLIAFAVARSIADAIPSVFLGAGEDMLSLQPAHQLLRKGQGLIAVKCSIAGALLGLVACVVLVPVLSFLFPLLDSFVRPFLFWIVLAAVVFLVAREEKWYWALIVFAVCGVFGILALKSVAEPLFPMLSGLFGASGLIVSLLSESHVPFQSVSDAPLKRGKLAKGVLLGVLAGCVLILAPGLGPSQGAALVQRRKQGAKQYLILTGALGTVDVVVSLILVAVLGRARNGAVVAVQSLVGSLSQDMLLALLGAALVAGGIAVIASVALARVYARFTEAVDPRRVALGVLALLIAGSIILAGPIGLLIIITATALGLIAPLLGVSRSHAMGCLLVPTLLLLSRQ